VVTSETCTLSERDDEIRRVDKIFYKRSAICWGKNSILKGLAQPVHSISKRLDSLRALKQATAYSLDITADLGGRFIIQLLYFL
jgi:hypothetical protein